MLRMTPLASAIVALLLGIEAYAAQETFDTHFVIGGMKDQQVANIRLDDNQPYYRFLDHRFSRLVRMFTHSVENVLTCIRILISSLIDRKSVV